MLQHNVLMEGTTEGMYTTSIANMQRLEGVTVSAITYDSDGLAVTGIEVLPTLAAGEKIPLMIYNRGGSGNYGMLSPGQVTVLMAPFAMRMRVGVLASNYRGNGGSEGADEFGGGDVHDVLNLLALGKQQPWWDGKNIFMLGWSRGGMMTYLALKHGAVVNAAAVGAGAADLAAGAIFRPAMEEHVYKRYIPDFAARREEAMRERSAVCWPELLSAPLLLLHGDADDKVHVDEARKLYAQLTALGKPVRYVEYAGGNHGLKQHWKQWVDEVVAWFEAYRK
ncbi:MAG: prolyl oligopeptidase family serine peptidase [Rickettsiales bacterium]|nr:prolyl oligopeptidase family serine peptidase [Rickettsiales bacterium]